jgi:hypothetical protein
MPAQALFGISVAFGFIAWGIVAAQYFWPLLRAQARVDALRPLLLLHSFRFVGLAFLVKGVVAPELPALSHADRAGASGEGSLTPCRSPAGAHGAGGASSCGMTDPCQFDILQSGPGWHGIEMLFDQLKRREFISLVGMSASWGGRASADCRAKCCGSLR